MVRIILLIFLFLNIQVSAETYYVSNFGNDLHDGLTQNTSWQTIVKIKSVSFAPNDSVLFKCGDVFGDSQFDLANGGSLAGRIIISSYGVGNKPVINGLDEITGWTTESNWTE